jgi:hypothetical protein
LELFYIPKSDCAIITHCDNVALWNAEIKADY